MTDTLPEVATLRPRRWTAAEFERMAEVGLLDEDSRVELIEGVIVDLSPVGTPHSAHVKRLMDIFVTQAAGRYTVGVQDPVRLSELTEPQPDVSVMAYREDYYAVRHPGPDDILLLIEVADSSLRTDRAVKMPLYGRAGVPESWLVDLTAGVVEAFTRPSAGGYDTRTLYRRGDRIHPTAIPGLAIAVSDLFR